MKVRRVVTGHNENGKAIFASDHEVDGITFETMSGLAYLPWRLGQQKQQKMLILMRS